MKSYNLYVFQFQLLTVLPKMLLSLHVTEL